MEPNSNQETSPSFWERQFNDWPTELQIIFDLLWGVILPMICLVVDPVIFRNGSSACINGISMSQLRIFAYIQIGLGIFALLFWLFAREPLERMSAFFAGIFFAGTISASLLGILLFPMSVILGFISFMTVFVYLRSWVRAWRLAKQTSPHISRNWLFSFALTTALLIYIVPGIIQLQAWGGTVPTLACIYAPSKYSNQ